MNYKIKLFFASTASILLILLSWNQAYQYNCYLAMLFPVAILIIISYSFIELKMKERICFRNCYFHRNTILFKLLTSRISVSIFYGVISIVMTITLVFSVVSFPLLLWLYLIVHTLLSVLLYKILEKSFKNMVNDDYKALFSREWTINIMAFFIIAVYVFIALYGYAPAYLTESLDQTIKNASNSISSSCNVINTILKFKVELESIFWWVTSNSTVDLNNPWQKVGVWMSFILFNSMAMLGINRFIIQVIYMLDKKLNRASL